MVFSNLRHLQRLKAAKNIFEWHDLWGFRTRFRTKISFFLDSENDDYSASNAKNRRSEFPGRFNFKQRVTRKPDSRKQRWKGNCGFRGFEFCQKIRSFWAIDFSEIIEFIYFKIKKSGEINLQKIFSLFFFFDKI